MNSTQPAAAAEHRPECGLVIDGETDLEAVLARLEEAGARSAELATGPQQLVGLHLGAVPRHGIRDRLLRAGIRVLALAPGIELRSNHPDEGVVADIDAHLKLAADVGAERVKLVLGGTAGARTDEADADLAGQRLNAMLPRAAELGVRLVVENSGPEPSAAALAALLETARLLSQQTDMPIADADSAAAQGPGAGSAETQGTDSAAATTADTQTSDGVSAAAPAADEQSAEVPQSTQIPPAGAVWNVKASIAAGETLAGSAQLLAPFLTVGHGYIRCDSAESAAALLRAVPEAAELPIVVAGAPSERSASS